MRINLNIKNANKQEREKVAITRVPEGLNRFLVLAPDIVVKKPGAFRKSVNSKAP